MRQANLWIWTFWLFAVISIAASCSLRAQTSTSELVGTVTDASGAPVPGAQITAEDLAADAHPRTVTNALGYYAFPRLQPGNYELRVHEEGFKLVFRSGIALIVSQTASVNRTNQYPNYSQTAFQRRDRSPAVAEFRAVEWGSCQFGSEEVICASRILAT